MNANISELEVLLSIQESYFNNLVELGLLFKKSGQYEKAIEVYNKGIEKAEKAKEDISGNIFGFSY